MKFALLVASVYAAAGTANSVADGSDCTADTDCSTATSSCCQGYTEIAYTNLAATKQCQPKIADTSKDTASIFYKTGGTGCAGRTAAGAASLAATAAAAATALYAML